MKQLQCLLDLHYSKYLSAGSCSGNRARDCPFRSERGGLLPCLRCTPLRRPLCVRASARHRLDQSATWASLLGLEPRTRRSLDGCLTTLTSWGLFWESIAGSHFGPSFSLACSQSSGGLCCRQDLGIGPAVPGRRTPANSSTGAVELSWDRGKGIRTSPPRCSCWRPTLSVLGNRVGSPTTGLLESDSWCVACIHNPIDGR